MEQVIMRHECKVDKLRLLKIALRASAIFQLIFWSFSHWFFPKFFFTSLGVVNVNFDSGFAISQVNIIGALVFALAVATWLAANDPIRNRVVIQTLYVAGISCIGVFVYNIFVGNLPLKAIVNVFAIIFQLILVGVLYPWKIKV